MTESNKYHLAGNTAELYQANNVRYLLSPWAERLMETAAIQPGERVLDVACGTGLIARLAAIAAGRQGAVTGLELNPAMLTVAQSLQPIDGAPIEWVEANAADMPLPDDAFDLALCQQGIQFFDDREASAREMHRVLRPGGRLALTVWRPLRYAPGQESMADVVEEFIGPEAASVRRAPYLMGEREVLRPLLEDAGFDHVKLRIDSSIVRFGLVENFLKCMIAGSPLSAFMADADPATVDAVVAAMDERLDDYLDDDGLALPMQVWLATARAG